MALEKKTVRLPHAVDALVVGQRRAGGPYLVAEDGATRLYQCMQSRMMSGAKSRPLNAALMPGASCIAAEGKTLASHSGVCNGAAEADLAAVA